MRQERVFVVITSFQFHSFITREFVCKLFALCPSVSCWIFCMKLFCLLTTFRNSWQINIYVYFSAHLMPVFFRLCVAIVDFVLLIAKMR